MKWIPSVFQWGVSSQHHVCFTSKRMQKASTSQHHNRHHGNSITKETVSMAIWMVPQVLWMKREQGGWEERMRFHSENRCLDVQLLKMSSGLGPFMSFFFHPNVLLCKYFEGSWIVSLTRIIYCITVLQVLNHFSQCTLPPLFIHWITYVNLQAESFSPSQSEW